MKKLFIFITILMSNTSFGLNLDLINSGGDIDFHQESKVYNKRNINKKIKFPTSCIALHVPLCVEEEDGSLRFITSICEIRNSRTIDLEGCERI